VQWQRRKTTAGRQENDRDYWRQRLDGARAPDLEVRPQTGQAPRPGSKSLQLDIDHEAWTAVRELARAEQTTPFGVLLSIYYAVIHRESGDADLSVASPFANRTRPEVMRTVGFFANLLVLRTRIQPGSTFLDLLHSTRSTVSEALAHQGFAHFLPPADEGGSGPRNIEDVIFQMLPELPAPITAGGLEIEVLPPMVASRFDLELSVLPWQGGLRALFQYAPERLGDAVADRLAAGCAEMVRRVRTGADCAI
jgi:non-ribosomal peptide synthetase component F